MSSNETSPKSNTDKAMELAAARFFNWNDVRYTYPSPPYQRPTITEYADQLRERNLLTPVVDESVALAQEVRRENQLVFYIAGALTGMSAAVKARYESVSELIAAPRSPHLAMFGYAPHLHGTDPVKHPRVTPREVRDIDFLWSTIVPNMHINFLNPVAHGNAIEAGWAEMSGVNSLHVAEEDFTASRLVRGTNGILGTVLYQDFETDALPQIDTFLQYLADFNEQGSTSSL